VVSRPYSVTGAGGTAQPPVTVVFETELGNIVFEVDVAHAPVTADELSEIRRRQVLRRRHGEPVGAAGQHHAARCRDSGHPVSERPGQEARDVSADPLERTSVTGLKHVDGALSMARSGPDSATSSFSIMVGDQPELDFAGKRNADGQGFAVFGRVVSGMDVVKKIHASKTGTAGSYGTETLDPPIAVKRAYRSSESGFRA
jgi:peptidyl-prolyl cis-trans isomerase A (cyclophilin A)